MNTINCPRHTERPRAWPASSKHKVRWPGRRVPLSHGRHVCGTLVRTLPARGLDFESLLERDVIDFLAQRRNLIAIHSQPFTLRVYVAGRYQVYTPDLLVVYDPVSRFLKALGFGAWTVVEVKPSARLEADRDQIYARLERVHRLMGFSAVCMTELEIQPQTNRRTH